MIWRLGMAMIIASLLVLGSSQGDDTAGDIAKDDYNGSEISDINESFIVLRHSGSHSRSDLSEESYMVRKLTITQRGVALENCSPFIHGINFNDKNGNGVKDSDEEGLAGWIVKLTRQNGSVLTTKTGNNGSYFFTSLDPGEYVISQNRQEQWIQTAPSSGYYSITVNDCDITPLNFGNTFVGSTNNPPNAPSKPDGEQSGITENQYSYSTSSIDPDGDQITYTFDWGDGTTTNTYLSNSGPKIQESHSWASPGNYRIKACASDIRGAVSDWSDTQEVVIKMPNRSPQNLSSPSGQASGIAGVWYQYTVSATDPDGDKIRYDFDWGDGTTNETELLSSGETASASHAWNAVGSYPVKARATDQNGASTDWSGTLTVSIGALNTEPGVPSTPAGLAAGTAGTSYQYITSSTDPNGDNIKYTFDWGDGTTGETALLTSGTAAAMDHAWSASGNYNVKAKATDANGASSGWSSPLAVSIGAPNMAPAVPLITPGSTSGYAFVLYTYSATATDADGDEIKYVFDWGDGTTNETALLTSGTAAGLDHAWSASGNYSVRAKAIDSRGMSSDWSSPVAMRVDPNSRPNTPNVPTTASASGVTRVSYMFTTKTTDPDGNNIKYIFDWGDGTTLETSYVGSGTQVSKMHSWEAKGTYSIIVKAMDSKGAHSGWSGAKTFTIK